MKRKRPRAKAIIGQTSPQQKLLDEAIRHHQSGRLAEAEALYREILAKNAGHADALHLLGVIAHQMRRHDIAVDLIRKAIDINPMAAAYHSNLGNALSDLGRLTEALAAFESAARIQPNFADSHYNRGNTLKELGRPGEALAAYELAICLKPDFPLSYINRGNTLQVLNRLPEAVMAFKTATHIQPYSMDAQLNRGNCLKGLGRIEDAIAAYDVAICLQPDGAKAYTNRGNALQALGRLKEALAAHDAAIVIEPVWAEPYCNFGNALKDTFRNDDALALYSAAICVKPDLAEAYYNRGKSLKELGHFDKALAAYRQAIRIKPDFALAHSNLLFSLHYPSELSDKLLLDTARQFASQFEGRVPFPAFCHSQAVDRRLRIGYVSADFCRHSVSYFFAPVLAHHDRRQFEIFCYSNTVKSDEMTERLRKDADHWRDVRGLSDHAAISLIRSDGIDILVDLSGHSAGNRLTMFAARAAPVQVTWLGYPGTTGLATMDYRLVDEVTDPIGVADDHCSEVLHRLPNGFLCYEPPDCAPEPKFLLGSGRPLTFGSFNNPAKLSNATLDVWSALLHRIRNAELVLKGETFCDPAVRSGVLDRFASRGVEPKRIAILEPMPTVAGHLAAYEKIDIALDPFPYNGTTTTFEALWMGVPVVTLTGTRHSGRVGASILNELGLRDLIASTTEGYVRVAVALAGDADRLAEWRNSLRPRLAASALCDAIAFSHKLETAYRAMWLRGPSNTRTHRGAEGINEARDHK